MKIAKKLYKAVPKKKLITNVVKYGANTIIGGPYLEIGNFFFKKSKKKVISYAGSYAYDSLLRSRFAREKINTLPMLIVATLVRIIMNFLIFSRIKTGIRWLDFIMSIMVTIVVTLLSPVFYKSISAHDEAFMQYTNKFIDRFMGPGGWEYVENVKNVIVLSAGIILVIIFNFVKIDSYILQEMVIHTLVTGFITDQIQKIIINYNTASRLYYGMGPIDSKCNVLGPLNYIETNYKTINYCNTDNIILLNTNPLKAKIIPHKDLSKISKTTKIQSLTSAKIQV